MLKNLAMHTIFLDSIGGYLKPLLQSNMSNNGPHAALPNCLNNLPSDMLKGCLEVLVAVRDRTCNNPFASTPYQFESMDMVGSHVVFVASLSLNILTFV